MRYSRKTVAILLILSFLVFLFGCIEEVIEKDPDYKYIGNKNTKVFHYQTCSYLPDSNNRCYFITRQEAINSGYRPCGKCKP
mgnify:CR=1 FL=1